MTKPTRLYWMRASTGCEDRSSALSGRFEWSHSLNLPPILCPRCGRWGSLGRLPCPAPAVDRIREIVRPHLGVPVAPERWRVIADDVAHELGERSFRIRPGARVGPPEIQLRHSLPRRLPPVLTIDPGSMWLDEETSMTARASGVPDWALERVECYREDVHGDRIAVREFNYWELSPRRSVDAVPSGCVGHPLCSTCVRTERSPSPDSAPVDCGAMGEDTVACFSGNQSFIIVVESLATVLRDVLREDLEFVELRCCSARRG